MEADRPDRRRADRRAADRQLRTRNRKYLKLLEFARIITSEINFDRLFKLIISETNRLMDTEICSIFLIDDQNQYLEAFISTDQPGDAIRISKDQGVAGWVFRNKSPLIVDDPYCDPRFCQDVDKQTGFKTRGILCVPLINRKEDCIGTIQVLNKRRDAFSDEDQEMLTHVANQVTIALENSMIYEELKASARSRKKAINHLSHELKTPLAILSTIFVRLSRSSPETVPPHLHKAIDRGRRNLARLFDIQQKVEDIVRGKAVATSSRLTGMIEHLADFVQELDEEENAVYQEILGRLSKRIDSILAVDEMQPVDIPLDDFLDRWYRQLAPSLQQRRLEIRPRFEKGLVIHTDRSALDKVCTGLLKNAVENTPDEGLIRIHAHSSANTVQIDFHDHGVGITPENQGHIFDGFFHTQETKAYSSKTPFAFNAGGTGTDLLRISRFAQRLGFAVAFESSRCRFIPDEADLCPGRVSQCGHVQDPAQCRASGHSRFRVTFPMAG